MEEIKVFCMMTQCPVKEKCPRHEFYLKALEESESITILNPKRIHYDEEGCEHRLTPQPQRLAYGFKRLAATIPQGNARNMDWGISFGSESTYFRTKRGERPLTPDEQGIILAHVKASGGDPDVGFDRYEDITVYVKWYPLK